MEESIGKLLASLQDEGRLDSQDSFTISEQSALRKLGESQLPFRQAWALKVIQAAVAGGAIDGICVQAHRDRTDVRFKLLQPWSSNGLRVALIRPDSSKEPGLLELCQALWSIGWGQARAFRLELQGSSEILAWDGSVLTTQTSKVVHTAFLLSVFRPACEHANTWLKRDRKSVENDLDLVTLLRERAFCCPVRLSVDSLEIQCPLALPCAPLELHIPVQLHSLSIDSPSLDFSNAHLVEPKPSEITPKQLTVPVLKQLKSLGSATALGVLSLHYQMQREGAAKPKEQPSWCYWVRNGVVVQKDPLASPQRFSLSYFLSADGLDCDISGFQLRQTPEYLRRQRLFRDALLPALERLSPPDLTPYRTLSDQARRVGGSMLVGACLLLSPISWPLAIGASAVAWWAAGIDSRALDKLEADMPSLLERLKADVTEVLSRPPAT